MSAEREILKREIMEILTGTWKESEKPLLLSKIPSLLKKENYKEILNGVSLKDFISETSGENGYKIVEDSRNKARVGIIPFSEKYTYQLLTSSRTDENKLRNNKDVLIDFLKMLSTLPDEELDSIVIPARVLVKLVS